tara:strand:+ start:733 stop:1005 length:273 start_codon:yes stop_codon:yes gene_type:complete
MKNLNEFLNENKLNDVVEAIFHYNSKNKKIKTGFGDFTILGLSNMISNDSYEVEEIANAIFDTNNKKGKIETGFGDKTLEGLINMIKSIR